MTDLDDERGERQSPERQAAGDGQQQVNAPQALGGFGNARRQARELAFRISDHVLVGGRVAQKALEIGGFLLSRLELANSGNDRREVRELLGELHAGCLAHALIEFDLDRLGALDQPFEFLLWDGLHGCF